LPLLSSFPSSSFPASASSTAPLQPFFCIFVHFVQISPTISPPPPIPFRDYLYDLPIIIPVPYLTTAENNLGFPDIILMTEYTLSFPLYPTNSKRNFGSTLSHGNGTRYLEFPPCIVATVPLSSHCHLITCCLQTRWHEFIVFMIMIPLLSVSSFQRK
jgi:hypothetical protein